MTLPPHGGKLVDRTVSNRKKERLPEEVEEMPEIQISQETVKDLQNIAYGAYSPLKGFMDRNNFLKVVEDKTLEDGTAWTVPIVLDVSPKKAEELESGEQAVLRGPKNNPLAVIDIDQVFGYNKKHAVKHLYGTTDTDHPGVKSYLGKGEYLVGGDIDFIQEGFTEFDEYNLKPAETRVLFEEKGWDTVVGFQTRNAPHRGHEYLQKSALEHVDAILIHPKIGKKKEGDYKDQVILSAYRSLLQNYYRGRAAMSIFAAKMRYMGPREAVFDAIVRKNYGCTHFIVGRDHAGVGDYYDEFGAQKIFSQFGSIGINPMFYDYAFFCDKCHSTTSEKLCPHGDSERISPSGTKIRNMLSEGKEPPEKMMRPEVAEKIKDFENPLVGGDK